MHPYLRPSFRTAALAVAFVASAASARAELVDVTVTVHNLQPANSVSFAALHLGFHSGSFDAFNIGQVATVPIIEVAERGTGAAWQAAFAAADPNAARGTVAGRLDPGMTRSATFRVDTGTNRYFTFASMVVPSNDFFIGNDNPLEYLLLDASGGLLIPSITVGASEIWDAGSEIFDPAAAAFVGSSALRRDQNSVVAFNFAELTGFNGLTTAAGTTFNSALTANSEIYRISFEVTPVPEPGSLAMLTAGLMGMGFLARRRLGGQGPETRPAA
ncbi:MAG: spondin domain-containing protein [Alphaproteobacteria bacterium]|jgi:hypothetical protein|nr:spondin domain-containing protein [Burkholderiaceae bacterium]MCZ8177052.1 spondin domain-containing protein [Burkholderiaceae bacterium]